MLKLHGFAVSNYYNLVKAAMLEKGVEFEEVRVYPSADPEFLRISPMGKVPVLETPEGVISESQAILEYLEETRPEPAMYPVDSFQRAKAREQMRLIELYLELPARRLYPEVFFGGSVSDETKKEVRPVLEKAAGALNQLAAFDPYMAGGELGYVDIAALVHLPLVSAASKKIYGEDMLAGVNGLADHLTRLGERPSALRVHEDYKTALDDFMKYVSGGR